MFLNIKNLFTFFALIISIVNSGCVSNNIKKQSINLSSLDTCIENNKCLFLLYKSWNDDKEGIQIDSYKQRGIPINKYTVLALCAKNKACHTQLDQRLKALQKLPYEEFTQKYKEQLAIENQQTKNINQTKINNITINTLMDDTITVSSMPEENYSIKNKSKSD